MSKTSLREFSIESRKDLINRIKIKLNLYFAEEEFDSKPNGDMFILTNEKHTLNLTKYEKQKRDLLLKRVKDIGIERVLEEAAYTWFNRLIAIRYMEIHDFLPLGKENESLGIRVLSGNDGTLNPEILKFSNLINNQLDINFDSKKYSNLSNDNEKFKYVLLLVCEKLKKVFPDVFDGETDYIDLLIPENLLSETGFVSKLIKQIDESEFEKVEIIGWLYQYYISEKKDDVFKDLKSGKKVSKQNIPAATQIFTPDWIVKYMVENTLGRYADESFKENLLYYDRNKNEKCISKEVKDIKFIDPCCGSGHILVYAFEVLYKMYEHYGYNKKDIAELILKNNLFGLDIDDRAGQLSTLSVLLKAREYDKNIFNKNIDLNIMSIEESNEFLKENIQFILNNDKNIEEGQNIVDIFNDAKEIGSLLILDESNTSNLKDNLNYNNIFNTETFKFEKILKCNNLLCNRYDVVVTNPPYMGNRGMDKKLDNYIKKNYSDFKTDMFSAFIKQAYNLTKENGYYALITQPTFLFISSFEKVREHLIKKNNIVSLLHMGRGIFGIDFGSAAFILKKSKEESYTGNYYKLNKRTFQYIRSEDIEKLYLNANKDDNFSFNFDLYKVDESDEEYINEGSKDKIKYYTNQANFLKLPNYSFAYWISQNFIDIFQNSKLSDFGIACVGLQTSDNKRFLREWYEVDFNKIGLNCSDINESIHSGKRWFPYNKGGDYRKWYGNCMEVVNWEDDGREIREYNNYLNSTRSSNIGIANTQYYFRESGTWGLVSSAKFSVRYSPKGAIFDTGGSSLFSNDILKYLIGLLNTNLTQEIMHIQNPTLNFQPGNVSNIPVIINRKEEVENIVNRNIEISKYDWDLYETSWNFKKHPLLTVDESTIEEAVNTFMIKHNNLRKELQDNENKLNKIFVETYKLTDEIKSDVIDDDITLSKITKLSLVKSFISYAVGCMFGRYSLNSDGLISAGNYFDDSKYECFMPDSDNIIPISENNDIYFDDDIVSRFKSFVSCVYGKENVEENLSYIANVLGRKGTDTYIDTIRKYFINDFYNDHCKIYQKRPIYWQFDSGKKNGFKALIYIHRYDKQLLSKLRVDYLHKTQDAYERIKNDANNGIMNGINIKENQNIVNTITLKMEECNRFDEKLGHLANRMLIINLDDGIKTNYELFEDILSKIK